MNVYHNIILKKTNFVVLETCILHMSATDTQTDLKLTCMCKKIAGDKKCSTIHTQIQLDRDYN